MKVTPEALQIAYTALTNSPGSQKAALLAAIESLPEPLPRLRPLAEMPAEVPEGVVRLTGYHSINGVLVLTDRPNGAQAFFLDVLPPMSESPKPSLQDELVTALEEVAEKLEARVKDKDGFQPELDRVRELIAKAKGGQQ